LIEEPYHQAFRMVSGFTVNPFTLDLFIALIAVLVLLILSALISGAEAAFFSLSPAEINSIKSSKSKTDQLIEKLLSRPEKLLATILVTNNLTNIGIIVISAYFSGELFDFSTRKINQGGIPGASCYTLPRHQRNSAQFRTASSITPSDSSSARITSLLSLLFFFL